MIRLSQQNIFFVMVNNQRIPDEGPKAARINLDFSLDTNFSLDITSDQQRGFLSMVQTLFIDNVLSPVPTAVNINSSGQIIVAPAGSQGYYNVLCPNPTRLQFSSTGGVLVPLFLINVPIAPTTWFPNATS